MISDSNEQLQQELEHTQLKPDCHSWWFSKMQPDTLEERYAIQFCFKLRKKVPQKRMECFRLLFDHLAWIEHQFLSGIRDSRKARSLWGMMRSVGGVRKLEHLSVQWHFQQDNAPVHNSILITDYLTKMGINTVPKPPYSLDLAPCDFWLFPKLRGCRFETIEEVKEAVTKVNDTLTQEDFHRAFQKLLERYNKYITAGGDYFEGD